MTDLLQWIVIAGLAGALLITNIVIRRILKIMGDTNNLIGRLIALMDITDVT